MEEQRPGDNPGSAGGPYEPVVVEEGLLELAQKGDDAIGVDVGASSADPAGAAGAAGAVDAEKGEVVVVAEAGLAGWDTYMPVSVPQDKSLRIHIGAPLEDDTPAERGVVVGDRIDTD